MKLSFRYAVFHYRIVVACHIVGFSSKVIHDSPAASLSYLWAISANSPGRTGFGRQ